MPRSPFTTHQLRDLMDKLEDGGFDGMNAVVVIADDLRAALAAIEELVDLRQDLTKLAVICTDKEVAQKLVELSGVPE